MFNTHKPLSSVPLSQQNKLAFLPKPHTSMHAHFTSVKLYIEYIATAYSKT